MADVDEERLLCFVDSTAKLTLTTGQSTITIVSCVPLSVTACVANRTSFGRFFDLTSLSWSVSLDVGPAAEQVAAS